MDKMQTWGRGSQEWSQDLTKLRNGTFRNSETENSKCNWWLQQIDLGGCNEQYIANHSETTVRDKSTTASISTRALQQECWSWKESMRLGRNHTVLRLQCSLMAQPRRGHRSRQEPYHFGPCKENFPCWQKSRGLLAIFSSFLVRFFR